MFIKLLLQNDIEYYKLRHFGPFHESICVPGFTYSPPGLGPARRVGRGRKLEHVVNLDTYGGL